MIESEGMKLKLETQAKLLELKRILNKVKDISFATVQLTKQYPIDQINQKTAEQLIEVFEGYIEELKGEFKK